MTHELIRSIFVRFDRELAGLLEKAKTQGERPPCKDGCFWCCQEPLYASQQEASLIVDRIREMPEAEQARIKQLVKDWADRFLASGQQTVEDVNALQYRSLKLWCPLLKDGRCLVYQDRPIGCRAHIARRDPKGCEDDALRPKQEFLHTSAMMRFNTTAEIVLHEDTELEHLGLWLLELLIGKRVESAARVRIEATDRPSPMISNGGKR